MVRESILVINIKETSEDKKIKYGKHKQRCIINRLKQSFTFQDITTARRRRQQSWVL
jgi:hypothetical protein